MKRALATAIGICLTWALFLGASGDVGISSSLPQKVGMSNDLASAMGGSYSGDASWDTVTVVLTMEKGMTSAYSRYDASVVAADTVLELETEVPLAYDCLLNTSANNASNVNVAAWYFDTTTDWNLYRSGRKIDMFRIDWRSFVPANAIIARAQLYLNGASSWYVGSQDSIYAVQMDNPGDNKWWTSKYVIASGGANDRPSYAHASWDYQIQGYDSQGGDTSTLQDYGFPEFSSDAWSPTLDQRTGLWDWGSAVDISGTRTSSNPWPDPIGIDLRNCVQSVVSGGVNNGILLGVRDYNGGSAYQHLTTIWDRTGTYTANRPWVEVTYITKRAQSRFPGGKDWAFVFCTDAGIANANTVYRDSMNARGWHYTIFIGGNEHDGAGEITTADLIAARAEGHEIGCMGLFHDNLPMSYPDAAVGDIVTYNRGDLWSDLTGSSTDWDKLLTTTSPKWLHDIMPGTWDDPYVGKSFAMGYSAWSGAVLKAMRYHYYDAYRVGNFSKSGYLTADHYFAHVARATFRPNETDSIWGGINPLMAGRPRNLVGYSINPARPYPTTNPDVGGAVEATVKDKTRQIIAQIRGDGDGYWILFSHYLRDSSAYGNAGITAKEFGWILDVVEEQGGAVMRFSELSRWLQSKATMVATPAAYAQNDSFKFAIGDSTWFELDHADSTFAPGLK